MGNGTKPVGAIQLVDNEDQGLDRDDVSLSRCGVRFMRWQSDKSPSVVLPRTLLTVIR